LNNFHNQEEFNKAVEELGKRDSALAMLLKRCGMPKMVRRQPGFASLVHIILEQQVSLASAQAAFDKLLNHVGELTPEPFMLLSDEQLRSFGFSRQKTRYCRGLAEALLSGELKLDSLSELDDESAHNELVKLKGIGRWTTDVYLMMALYRPDIWPVGDLALVIAMQKLRALPQRPDKEEMMRLAEPWRPYRSAAAHILWTFYLSDGFKQYPEE